MTDNQLERALQDIDELERAIFKTDEQLLITEGIGLVRLLGDLPEAEFVRRVLEKADLTACKRPSTETQ